MNHSKTDLKYWCEEMSKYKREREVIIDYTSR